MIVLPARPDAGKHKHAGVLRVDKIGLLAVGSPLPFVKTIGWDQASSLSNERFPYRFFKD